MHTKDTQFADWLQWFAMDAETGHQLVQRFYLADGRRAATDGHTCVVTDEPGDATKDVKPNVPEKLAELMQMQALQEATFAADELFAAVGPCSHPEAKKCSRCGGKKTVRHVCDCELCEAEVEECDQCGGDGITLEHDDRYITVWNHLFDRNRIGYVLEHASRQEQYTLRLTSGAGRNFCLLHIVTLRWHTIIVSMSEQTKREHEMPELLEFLNHASV